MDATADPLLRNKIGIWGLVTAIGAWLFCLLVVTLFWAKLPPQLPFFYSLPWGESWLLARDALAWVLGGFALILIFNLLLARTVLRTYPLLQNYLVWGAATVEFMLAVDLVKIIDLVL